MKFKDYQKLKKEMKEPSSTEADLKLVTAAKLSGEKLKTAVKNAETQLKPVED